MQKIVNSFLYLAIDSSTDFKRTLRLCRTKMGSTLQSDFLKSITDDVTFRTVTSSTRFDNDLSHVMHPVNISSHGSLACKFGV